MRTPAAGCPPGPPGRLAGALALSSSHSTPAPLATALGKLAKEQAGAYAATGTPAPAGLAGTRAAQSAVILRSVLVGASVLTSEPDPGTHLPAARCAFYRLTDRGRHEFTLEDWAGAPPGPRPVIDGAAGSHFLHDILDNGARRGGAPGAGRAPGTPSDGCASARRPGSRPTVRAAPQRPEPPISRVAGPRAQGVRGLPVRAPGRRAGPSGPRRRVLLDRPSPDDSYPGTAATAPARRAHLVRARPRIGAVARPADNGRARRPAGRRHDRRRGSERMTLEEGRRVRLAEDLGIGEAVGGEPGAVVGFLSLAAGTEGTVERVDGELPQSTEVREYQRLKALFEDFGHTMPVASRERLEEQVAALEPEWTAYQERGNRVTVRVRLDNGFVLDGAHQDILTPL